MITINGKVIYNQDTAREFLVELGMDRFDLESFIDLLCAEYCSELEWKLECVQDDKDCLERSIDGYTSALNDVLEICDEKLKRQKITKSREAFEAIGKIVNRVI